MAIPTRLLDDRDDLCYTLLPAEVILIIFPCVLAHFPSQSCRTYKTRQCFKCAFDISWLDYESGSTVVDDPANLAIGRSDEQRGPTDRQCAVYLARNEKSLGTRLLANDVDIPGCQDIEELIQRHRLAQFDVFHFRFV